MSNLKGKRVAVLVEKFYEDLELWYPVLRLREAGCQRPDRRPQSRRDLRIQARLSRQVRRRRQRGQGVRLRRRHHPRRLFARPHAQAPRDGRPRHPGRQAGQGPGRDLPRPLDALLGQMLEGPKVTGFFAIRDDVENAGGIWQDAACVRDGNIVTSRTPDDLPAFMQGIFAALEESGK